MSGYWSPEDAGAVWNEDTGEWEFPGPGGSGGPALSDADPLADGTADPGTSEEASRADHVHADSGGGFDGVHNDLDGRSTADAHPISAITGFVVSPSEPASPQDGWVWFDTNTLTVKGRVDGAWVTFGVGSAGTARLTEDGATRITEDGQDRLLEGV